MGWDVLAALRWAGAGCRVASLPGGKAAELKEWGSLPWCRGLARYMGPGGSRGSEQRVFFLVYPGVRRRTQGG